MEYFLLKQDERYINTPVIKDIKERIDIKDLNEKNIYKIKDFNAFHIKESSYNIEFLDILDRQLYLISDKLMELLTKFDETLSSKKVTLIDIKNKAQKNYHLPILEEIDAMSTNTEIYFYKEKINPEIIENPIETNLIKKLVLNKEKIKGRQIFRIKKVIKPLVVIDLHIAEAILRREFDGISLKKVELD